eukprot:618405-Amphidinium_carterae.2
MLLDCRVVLLCKPHKEPASVDSWRPITISSAIYRLYMKARLFTSISGVLPNLHQYVLGGVPGRRIEGEMLRMLMMPERHARGIQVPCFGITLDASK